MVTDWPENDKAHLMEALKDYGAELDAHGGGGACIIHVPLVDMSRKIHISRESLGSSHWLYVVDTGLDTYDDGREATFTDVNDAAKYVKQVVNEDLENVFDASSLGTHAAKAIRERGRKIVKSVELAKLLAAQYAGVRWLDREKRNDYWYKVLNDSDRLRYIGFAREIINLVDSD